MIIVYSYSEFNKIRAFSIYSLDELVFPLVQFEKNQSEPKCITTSHMRKCTLLISRMGVSNDAELFRSTEGSETLVEHPVSMIWVW